VTGLGRSVIRSIVLLLVAAAVSARTGPAPQAVSYPWLERPDPAQSLESRIPAPDGWARMTLSSGSFGEWLRTLPLKPGTPDVLLYDGRKKADQSAHQAVVDLDVGPEDLQQCADAIIRLRAEYLYSRERYGDIHFHYTSGEDIDFMRWSDGYRPRVGRRGVDWVKAGPPDWSHAGLRAYLDNVFRYAGTSSLSRELAPVADPKQVRAGDVFIRGGFPGHAALVVDVACRVDGSRKLFLLAQSFMPAQEVYVLRNPVDTGLSPWFEAGSGPVLVIPEWTFGWNELKRFPDE
jgi:hypothetical protein